MEAAGEWAAAREEGDAWGQTQTKMAPQAAQFDLSTSFLDIPKTLGYGLVRGAGNLILQQELPDKIARLFLHAGRGSMGFDSSLVDQQ